MSEKKKDLSAFLKKNQKKVKKTEAPAEVVVETKKEEEKPKEQIKSTTQKKDESSDEEVDDELDLETQAMSYGNIKEKKDIISEEKHEEAETLGYGYENTVATGGVSNAAQATKAKKDASDITFGGGRPKFGRKVNKGQFGAEFSEGLDDLDDDGAVKKSKNQNKQPATGMQREFINLGSGARSGFRPEEKEEETKKPTGVKPTFKGRMNLNKNQDNDNQGVNTNYDFKVSYKTNDDEGVQKKDKKPREKGVPLHQAMAQTEEDDEFQIVRNKERRPHKVRNDDSSSDEDAAKIIRGDARGQRGGRGGFFKNSNKN